MSHLNVFKIALRALRRNKLRSILTALGIIIGVGAVIAMVGIGNGAKAQIEARIAAMGENVLLVFPGSFRSGGMRSGWGGAATLTAADAEAIARQVPGVVAVSPEVRDRAQVFANGQNWNTQLMGESPDFAFIRNWPVARGAMFTNRDVQSLAKVAVVGQTVVDQLFPNQNPLGKLIRIRDIPFEIVGVLAAKGFNLFGADQDDFVLIPYTSHLHRFSRRPFLNSILVRAARPELSAAVTQGITDLLVQRHRVSPANPDFTVRSQVEIEQAVSASANTMTLLLGAIAGVSLIVGGIGIMNIMLVSVTERTREIGIRLAVGAHGRDVLLQFLIEAVILSLMGGILGAVLGVGSSDVMARVDGWPVLVSPASVVIAVLFSAAIGVFFGFYPARKAAQLDPIDALRFE
ncbi:MAG TPA: ABC transporter permease [Opitutaceae bacterium]|nr:ABC transporter permease [Opitutaceae bacterium]